MNWREQAEFVFGKHWNWLEKPMPEWRPIDALDRISEELVLNRLLAQFFVDFFHAGEEGVRQYPMMGPAEIPNQKPWEYSLETIQFEAEGMLALGTYDFSVMGLAAKDSPGPIDTICVDEFSVLLQPASSNYLVTIANFPVAKGDEAAPFDSDEAIKRVRGNLTVFGGEDSAPYMGRQDASFHEANKPILLVDPRLCGKDESEFQRAVEASAAKGQGQIVLMGDIPEFFILDEAERTRKRGLWPELREQVIAVVTGRRDRRPDISIPDECRRLFLEAKEHYKSQRFNEQMMHLGKACEIARKYRFPNSVNDEKVHWNEIAAKYNPNVRQALIQVRAFRNRAAHSPGSSFTLIEAADALSAAEIGLRNLLARKDGMGSR